MTEEKQIDGFFTDEEDQLYLDIWEGLGIQDYADECIWKKARVENCVFSLSKKGYRKQVEGERDSIIEQIIRKKAEVSEYWQNDVKQYRAMQGYSDIEHDVDNFLRGYNEAVEDVLAILDGAKMKGGE